MTMRKIVVTSFALMLVIAVGVPAIHAGGAGQNDPTTTMPTLPSQSLAGLQKALDLTDAQVSPLQSLVQSQASSLQTLLTNVRTAQQSFQTALKGTDTAAIGTAALAVQSAETALTNAQKANRQALLAVLTTAQQQIVNDYLLIAQNGGLGLFGQGFAGQGPGGQFRGPGAASGPVGAPQFLSGPRPFGR